MTNKYEAILVGTIITVIFISSLVARAAELNLPDLEQTKGFIFSAKKIVSSFATDSDGSEGFWQTLANVWSSADGWFFETTGVHMLDAFKAVGNFIVWFLELVLSLFKWLLSLVE